MTTQNFPNIDFGSLIEWDTYFNDFPHNPFQLYQIGDPSTENEFENGELVSNQHCLAEDINIQALENSDTSVMLNMPINPQSKQYLEHSTLTNNFSQILNEYIEARSLS